MNDLPNHWAPALQALAYWIAYKQQYYSNSLLPEGAIVAELTQLLSSNIENGLRVECEKMYKELDDTILDGGRADIIIGKKGKLKDKKGSKITKDDIREVVEVKRYEGSFDRLVKDMEKLNALNITWVDVRKYLVVVGQKKLPEKIFTVKYNVKRNNIYTGNGTFKAIPRIGKKAYPTKKKSTSGAYAALIEIL
jgi:hypothetical protein